MPKSALKKRIDCIYSSNCKGYDIIWSVYKLTRNKYITAITLVHQIEPRKYRSSIPLDMQLSSEFSFTYLGKVYTDMVQQGNILGAPCLELGRKDPGVVFLIHP
jgi:hypothetical protein